MEETKQTQSNISIDSEQYVKQLAKDLRSVFYAFNVDFDLKQNKLRREIHEYLRPFREYYKFAILLYVILFIATSTFILFITTSALMLTVQHQDIWSFLLKYFIFFNLNIMFVLVLKFVIKRIFDKKQTVEQIEIQQKVEKRYKEAEEEIFYLASMYIRHNNEATQAVKKLKEIKNKKHMTTTIDSCEKLQRAFEVIKEKLSVAQENRQESLELVARHQLS